MKHTRFLFVALAALALIACSKKDEPTYNPGGGGSTPGGGDKYPPVISFSMERLSPIMVDFANTSQYCNDFTWDFGDGTTAHGKDATHEYEELGTYIVRLIGKVDGKEYETRQKLELTKPTGIWITGYTIYKIPYENKYYRFSFKDDALLPSSWDWYSTYTPKLTEGALPYVYEFQNPQKFDQPYTHEYWKIQMLRANSQSGSGETSCLTGKLTLKDLERYQPSYTWRSDAGTTAFSIHIGYEY